MPSLGRTHSAIRRIASSASGARPAAIWKVRSMPGKTSSRVSTPTLRARESSAGVVKQRLVPAHLDVDRAEAAQVGVERVHERIAGVAGLAQEVVPSDASA